jgi:hypothetical protein
MGEGNKGGGRTPGSLESCGGPVCLPNLTDLETFLTYDSDVMERGTWEWWWWGELSPSVMMQGEVLFNIK